MTRVLHASPAGTVALLAHNLETDEKAVIVTTPIPKSFLPSYICGVGQPGRECQQLNLGDGCAIHRRVPL